MFFQNWSGIVRTLVVGTMAYVALVLALRVSGNRTLAKLNAFDLIVTVALGSVLASILLSEGVALAEGVVAFVLLIGLQYLVAYLSVRSRGFAQTVRSEPALIARDGEPLPQAMHRARVTRAELDSVLRNQGFDDVSQVASVVLESDGSFSVVGQSKT